MPGTVVKMVVVTGGITPPFGAPLPPPVARLGGTVIVSVTVSASFPPPSKRPI